MLLLKISIQACVSPANLSPFSYHQDDISPELIQVEVHDHSLLKYCCSSASPLWVDLWYGVYPYEKYNTDDHKIQQSCMGHAWVMHGIESFSEGKTAWGSVFNAAVYKIQARKCLLSVPREKEKLLLSRWKVRYIAASWSCACLLEVSYFIDIRKPSILTTLIIMHHFDHHAPLVRYKIKSFSTCNLGDYPHHHSWCLTHLVIFSHKRSTTVHQDLADASVAIQCCLVQCSLQPGAGHHRWQITQKLLNWQKQVIRVSVSLVPRPRPDFRCY